MKNKYTYFIYKMLLKMIIGCIIATGIIIILMFLHTKFFAWDIMVFLSEIGLYHFFITNKVTIIWVLFTSILSITFVTIILRFRNYLNKITVAVEQVFSEEETEISLPEDLFEMEQQLNQISKNLRKRELAAKKSEQQKNDLIVYLAHDLKTPLASVIGYLNLMIESPDLPQETRAKYMNITLDRAQRLEELINELFDITKFNLHSIELEKSQLNLTMMLHQILEEFYPMFSEKHITLLESIDSHLLYEGDGDKLARVFDNLLRNAINYSYPDTVISVTAKKEDDAIMISFANQGDTIPPGKLDLIFEKFYRVDSSRSSKTGGSGLGLAVAKEIVQLHQGTITALSEENQTIFKVILNYAK